MTVDELLEKLSEHSKQGYGSATVQIEADRYSLYKDIDEVFMGEKEDEFIIRVYE